MRAGFDIDREATLTADTSIKLEVPIAAHLHVERKWAFSKVTQNDKSALILCIVEKGINTKKQLMSLNQFAEHFLQRK